MSVLTDFSGKILTDLYGSISSLKQKKKVFLFSLFSCCDLNSVYQFTDEQEPHKFFDADRYPQKHSFGHYSSVDRENLVA